MAVFNKTRDRNADGSPKRRPKKWDKWARNPGWFNRIYNTPRHRTSDRLNIALVMHGTDPDGISWSIHTRPKVFYW